MSPSSKLQAQTSIYPTVWRDLMPSKLCACCGLPFLPVPQVPAQAYCSQDACQRARRQRWHKKKLDSDPDYRENKQRSQRSWLDRNPDYWRQYRAANPDHAARNPRHPPAKLPEATASKLAKMDESTPSPIFQAGIYRITPLRGESNDRNAPWTVQLTLICMESQCATPGCKVDECKDST